MTVQELVDSLGLTPLSLPHPDVEIRSGYVGDMPSWVMGNASEGCAWVTILNNRNIVAVAVLLEMACVIVTEGADVSDEVTAVAKEQDVNLLCAEQSSFDVVAKMAQLL